MGAVVFFCVVLSAGAFPLGKSSPKLDPRDAAFAPVEIAPLQGGVQWGVPLDGGPLRVLFIAPRFALRDAAELAHRLEMRVETVALWDATHLGRPEFFPREIPGTSVEEVLGDLREKLDKKLDVIVAANFDFSVFPPEAFGALAEKVRGGTGLVLAHHRHTLPDAMKTFLEELAPDPNGAIVTHGLGETLTAEWMTGLGFVQSGTIGEGRVVEIDYQGEWPLTHCLIPALTNPLLAEVEDFDIYLSLAARATRWAAGHDVPVTVAGVHEKPMPGPEAEQIPPGLDEMVEANLPAGTSMFHAFQLDLSAPADRTYTVRTGVRQRGRGQPPVTITQTRDPLRKGSQTHEFYVVAGAGDYWLDVWLIDGDKIVEWYSDAITIDAWPNISDVALSKSSVLPQDSVGITFTMTAGNRPCIALARATDSYGRIVSERHQPIPPKTALVQLGMGFTDLIGDSLKIEVFVSDRDMPEMPEWDTRTCAYAYKRLPVRANVSIDSYAVVTDVTGSVEFNARAVYRGLAASGFDTATFPATEETMRVLTSSGLRTIPQVTTYYPYQSAPSDVRAPCLTDPNFIVSEQAHLKGMAQIVRDYPTAAISLGEGNALSWIGEDLCRCPNCTAGFGEYLRKAYADLGAMNRAWGTSYESWDTITPPTAQQARESKRYAPWIDFRSYMDSVFVNTHAAARGLVRMADPRARAGIAVTTTEELFTGYDWAALASRLDMLSAPADPRITEIVRGARAPSALAGIELPLDASPEMLRRLPWYAVLHRSQSVWWPDVTASTVNVPVLVGVDPLGNAVPFAPEFLAESSDLQHGLARLWLKSTPLHSDVALYTSRTSAWLNHIDAQFGVDSASAERAYAVALNALGYAFDFVSQDTVEKGGLSGYRALILPMVRAMGDAEISAIRSYAASGGCVIADVAPGAYDEHGAPRETPPLSEVFGVRYAKPSGASGVSTALVELDMDDAKASGDFADIRADAGVEAVDAQVGGLAGTVPVWLLHKDKPMALLLNHAVTANTLDRARGMFDDVLRIAGAQRTVDVEARKGRDFTGERFAATFGTAALVALLADGDAPENTQKLRLSFDRAQHVYDVRADVPVLRSAKVDVELPRGGAALYSVLPYEVTACALTVVPTSPVGARLPLRVAIETKGGAAGDHLVRIEVSAVTTETLVPMPHYDQEMVCAHGEGNGYLSFALNDPTTRYKIVARDLLTGTTGEAFVNLTNAKRN